MNPTPKEQPSCPAQAPISVFVGIDWADAKHDICLLLPGEEDARHVQIENTPEALHDWVLKLIEEFGARGNIYVATEKARGALLYTLMQYPQLTLFPLNSKATGKLREALRAGGAKNDRWDCRLQAELVKHFHHLLPVWRPDDVLTRKLAALCEGRRKAVNTRTRLGQEIKAQLKASFPFALELLEGDCQSLLAADFLSKWPDLASLQRAGAATIRRFFYARNYRRMDRIELLLAKLKTTKPLTTDEAVIIPSALVLRTLAAQLRALLPFLAQYDKVLRSTFDQHPDAELFRSVPGAGEVMAPRLLTAFGSDRARFANAEAVSTFSGIAPVTKSSGKSLSHHLRYACAKFLRQSFHEFAARLHTSLCLGQGLLRQPACSQQGPSHRRSRPRLQMDPHPLCLLEITNPIQRISLSPIPQKPPRSNRQMPVNKSALFPLANYLRLSAGRL